MHPGSFPAIATELKVRDATSEDKFYHTSGGQMKSVKRAVSDLRTSALLWNPKRNYIGRSE